MMKTRDDDKKEKRRLSATDWVETADTGGSSSTLNLPSGVRVAGAALKKDGEEVRIDVIPYKVGEGHPTKDPGEEAVSLTYYVHKDVGPDGKWVPCNAKNSERRKKKKRCFICEERARLRRDEDADEDFIKTLWPSPRELYNIRVHGKDDNVVQVFEQAPSLFGESLRDKIKKDNRREKPRGWQYFADPNDGFTLNIGVKEERKKYKFYTFTDIEFEKREEPLPDELVEAAVCLEDIVKFPEYDEVKAMFLGATDDDDDDKGKKGGKGKKPKDEDDDDDEPKKKPKPKDEDDEDDDEPKPKKKPKDEDDEDDDEPKKKPKPKDEEDEEEEGFKLGQKVKHKKHGVCKVVKIKGDKITIENDDTDTYAVPAVDLTPVVAKEEKPKKKPKDEEPLEEEDDDDEPKPKKKPKDEDDEDDDEPKKKPKDEEDEDDEDDDDD